MRELRRTEPACFYGGDVSGQPATTRGYPIPAVTRPNGGTVIRKFASLGDALLGRVVPRLSAHALEAGCTLQHCGPKGCFHTCCPGRGCGPCACPGD